jgi:hypothetical protein
MKTITIESPMRICEYANKIVSSWKLTYMGKDNKEGTYHYILTHKENNRIKISVDILSEIEQMYNPGAFEKLDNEYVKIHCKDLNVPLKRGCTKFIRVEEFKEVRRVFNMLHDAGRQLLQ